MARALEIMVESGKSIGAFVPQEDGAFLGHSLESIHLQVKVLVELKVIVADTNALFPPPPVRVVANLAMPETLQAGGDAASVTGKFEATGKIATLIAKVYQDTLDVSRHFEIPQVDLTGRPKDLDLTGKLWVTAKSTAAAGTYRLEVVVVDAEPTPNSIKAVVGVQVMPAADTMGPSIQILSPSTGTVLENDVSTVEVKAQVEDPSGVDSVWIGDKLAVGKDGIWNLGAVEIPVTDIGFAVVVRAKDNKGNFSSKEVLVGRKAKFDPGSPTWSVLSPKANELFPFDSTAASVAWKVSDPRAEVVKAWIGGGEASKAADGIWIRRVDLPATGSLTTVALLAVNASNDTIKGFVQVTREADTKGPVIQIKSPVDGTAFAYDAQSVLVKVAATDLSGIDSVKIDGKLAEPVGTEYVHSMVLEAGKEAVIRVEAWDKLKNRSFDSIRVTRKGPPDTTAPRLKLLGPASGTELSLGTKTAILRWLVTDLFGLVDADVKIDGKVAQRSADTFSLEVAAPAPGKEESHRIDVKNVKGISNFETMSLKRAKDDEAPKLLRVDSGRTVAFDTEKATVSWKVTDNYKLGSVTIGGTTISGVGSLFSLDAPLDTGDNRIFIVASDSTGNTSEDVVVVRRPLPPKKLAWVAPSDIQGIEDSVSKLAVVLDGIRGGKARITVRSPILARDTTFEIVGAEQETIHALLVPANNRSGADSVELLAVSGSDTARSGFRFVLAARNDPPRFEIAKSIPAINGGQKIQIAGWAANMASGPQDESTQKLAFEVVAVEAADLLVGIPNVDANGTIALEAKVGVSGRARFQVRLHDNGDSSTGHANTSAWQVFVVGVNAAPSVTLPVNVFSMVQNTSASPGSLTVSDEETSVSNLTVVRTSSNSALMPPESVAVSGTGSNRKLTLRPVRDRAGSVVLTFTVRDSMGAESSESMAVEVKSVNKAPTFSLSVTSLVLQNYNQDSVFAKLVVNESTNDSLQFIKERKVELIGAPFESVLVAKPVLDGSGTLHLPRIPNPRGSFLFRVTIRDNGGVENGGVDSASKDLRIFFSDTIVDGSDGNVYKYVFVAKRAWLRDDLRKKPSWGDDGNVAYYDTSNGGRYFYDWAQAYDLDSIKCYGKNCAADYFSTRGLCPVGWNIPDSLEWQLLVNRVADGQDPSRVVPRLKSRTGWGVFIYGAGEIFDSPGTDDWGLGLLPNYFSLQRSSYVAARYWTRTTNPTGNESDLDQLAVSFSSTANAGGYDHRFWMGAIEYARYAPKSPIRCVKSLPPGQW